MGSQDAVSVGGGTSQQATGQSGDRQTAGTDLENEERLRGNETGDYLIQSSRRMQHARPSVGMETSVLFNEWEKG